MDNISDFYSTKVSLLLDLLKDLPSTGKVDRSYSDYLDLSVTLYDILNSIGYNEFDILDRTSSAMVTCIMDNGFFIRINTSVDKRGILKVCQVHEKSQLDHIEKCRRLSGFIVDCISDDIRFNGVHKIIV